MKIKKGLTKLVEDEEDEEDTRDWWTKYYATIRELEEVNSIVQWRKI